jgi:hypothetical protein
MMRSQKAGGLLPYFATLRASRTFVSQPEAAYASAVRHSPRRGYEGDAWAWILVSPISETYVDSDWPASSHCMGTVKVKTLTCVIKFVLGCASGKAFAFRLLAVDVSLLFCL